MRRRGWLRFSSKGNLEQATMLAANAEYRGANLVHGMIVLRQNDLEGALRATRAILRRDPLWSPGPSSWPRCICKGVRTDLAVDTLNQLF
ncbi:hypothetical protein SAMN07250955_105164 [Arboricoccus pini]|uniref:Uncharacterized protein n=1 Tax=Arboricoccus pini TaxID=1963835 RepID=A0A212R3U5_9PROT|nr:hypothetical protein SAMN07250955_105164 [Arboricoccus pini]